MNYNFLLLLLLLLSLQSCSTSKKNTKSFNWENFKRDNPSLYLENRPVLNGDLANRFIELSEKDIENVKSMFSKVEHLKILPKPVNKSNQSYSWFKKEIKNIQLKVQDLLLKRVYAWSLVKNLGASATVLQLKDKYHYEEKGIILLDISLFKKSYKDVCSFKESTVYQFAKGESIQCDYVGADISFAKAIFYHEAGHLFHNLNPIFSRKMKPSNSKFFPFNRHSWIKHGYEKDEIISYIDEQLPDRKNIKYYSKDLNTKISGEKISEILAEWEKSNFFTLYSMTFPTEDWAESFTHYIIKKYHNGKYVVKYTNSSGKIVNYKSCKNSNACKKKLKLVEVYIKNIDQFI